MQHAFLVYLRMLCSSSPRKPIASLKGCNFNEPAEGPLDLYAPRYVKGSGREKVGLCPICVEPPRRGGEGKKLLLKTKVSAYSKQSSPDPIS